LKIKALKGFVARNQETGDLSSYIDGNVYEISSDQGKQFIKEGLAEEYSVAPKKAKAEKK